jgi:hypothetical protein
MGLYHFIDRRWASNSMELKLSSYLALSGSYPVETFRHDAITYLEGADFDLPGGAILHRLSRALGALTRRAVAC